MGKGGKRLSRDKRRKNTRSSLVISQPPVFLNTVSRLTPLFMLYKGRNSGPLLLFVYMFMECIAPFSMYVMIFKVLYLPHLPFSYSNFLKCLLHKHTHTQIPLRETSLKSLLRIFMTDSRRLHE